MRVRDQKKPLPKVPDPLEGQTPEGVIFWHELEDHLYDLREGAIVALKMARDPFAIGEGSGRLNQVDELLNLPETLKLKKALEQEAQDGRASTQAR